MGKQLETPGRVRAVLAERFPAKTVPYGTWTALAEELGLRGAYIGAIAKRAGWIMEAPRSTRPVRNVKAVILGRLEKQYPCAEVTFGFYVDVAQEMEVSPQYVRQVAMQAGWVSANRPKSIFLCQCGREVGSAGTTCRECHWVEVDCEHCEKPVCRRLGELILRRKSGLYSGRIFCNRTCFAAFRKGRPLPRLGDGQFARSGSGGDLAEVAFAE